MMIEKTLPKSFSQKWPLLLLSLALAALTSQCYYDSEEELYSNYPQNQCDTSQVTFSAQISPIIAQNCAIAGCHAGANPTAGLNLSQFENIQTIALNGKLVGRITGTGGALMPPTGALPNCDINLIKNWVNQGAPDN